MVVKVNNGPGSNTGHGHVWIRPDGVRMRCGGPAICSECAKDAARWGSDREWWRDTLSNAPMETISAELARRGLALCGHTTDEDVFAELRRRGWQIGIEDKPVPHPKLVRIQSKPRSERNTVPEEKWLEVHNAIMQALRENDEAAISCLTEAMRRLYELLEPPSVRERRMNGG